jgi:hypothetical protein
MTGRPLDPAIPPPVGQWVKLVRDSTGRVITMGPFGGDDGCGWVVYDPQDDPRDWDISWSVTRTGESWYLATLEDVAAHQLAACCI